MLKAIIKGRKDLIRRNGRVKPRSRSELVMERVNWLIRVIVVVLIALYPNVLVSALPHARNLFFRGQTTWSAVARAGLLFAGIYKEWQAFRQVGFVSRPPPPIFFFFRLKFVLRWIFLQRSLSWAWGHAFLSGGRIWRGAGCVGVNKCLCGPALAWPSVVYV